jgi:D-inositol-3-phosphate glycosyltransferase
LPSGDVGANNGPVTARLAIYSPLALFGRRRDLFGATVANEGLYRALIQHGGFACVDVVAAKPQSAAALATVAPAGETATRIETGSVLDGSRLAAAGTVLRGHPDIADLAWLRRSTLGDEAYSLVGLIHTLGPPLLREAAAATAMAPTQPWDALVCTSPAVRQAVEAMFEAQAEHLRERFGATRSPRPALPVVPLGVDAAAMAAKADRPQARARVRREYGLADDDVLVLWVGRLSFFEKAFPQPMFRALEAAAGTTGARVAFALAGWFPEPERHQPLYQEAAAAHAPGVDVRFENGNDQARLADLWAAADVFVSLVDNIQETFGITPLEAMAAGLPVVASDWDGYRYTIEHGAQGLLIPTLGGPQGGTGLRLAAANMLALERYETFAGRVAQHTAVHVGKAAEALAALIA